MHARPNLSLELTMKKTTNHCILPFNFHHQSFENKKILCLVLSLFWVFLIEACVSSWRLRKVFWLVHLSLRVTSIAPSFVILWSALIEPTLFHLSFPFQLNWIGLLLSFVVMVAGVDMDFYAPVPFWNKCKQGRPASVWEWHGRQQQPEAKVSRVKQHTRLCGQIAKAAYLSHRNEAVHSHVIENGILYSWYAV